MYDPNKEFPAGKKGKYIKIDRRIDYQISEAAKKHRIPEISIIERGSGSLARSLLKEKPITEGEA